jgi:hypothetical protein
MLDKANDKARDKEVRTIHGRDTLRRMGHHPESKSSLPPPPAFVANFVASFVGSFKSLDLASNKGG